MPISNLKPFVQLDWINNQQSKINNQHSLLSEVLMSGVKGRTGRKPYAEVKELRAQLDEAISPSDWHDIWRAVVTVAKKGNVPAVKLLVEYRFGVASAQVEETANVGMVAYYLPARSDMPLPASLGPDPYAPTDPSLAPAPGAAARIPA
jgi:hypothetical protein